MGKLACGPRPMSARPSHGSLLRGTVTYVHRGKSPMLAHPSHGSWPIASFTYGPRGQVCMRGRALFGTLLTRTNPYTGSSTDVPSEKACMRSRAHVGTPLTPIVAPSCSTCSPCGQFCMRARANPFRRTPRADRARKGARHTALVGKSAFRGPIHIGTPLTRLMHQREVDLRTRLIPQMGFHLRPQWASSHACTCRLFVHPSQRLRPTDTPQPQWGSSNPLRHTPRTDRAHRLHLLSL